jgi:hypothetical protein
MKPVKRYSRAILIQLPQWRMIRVLRVRLVSTGFLSKLQVNHRFNIETILTKNRGINEV